MMVYFEGIKVNDSRRTSLCCWDQRREFPLVFGSKDATSMISNKNFKFLSTWPQDSFPLLPQSILNKLWSREDGRVCGSCPYMVFLRQSSDFHDRIIPGPEDHGHLVPISLRESSRISESSEYIMFYRWWNIHNLTVLGDINPEIAPLFVDTVFMWMWTFQSTSFRLEGHTLVWTTLTGVVLWNTETDVQTRH